jgi:WhiB family redox-sensing transcriptional regulator
MSKTQHLPKPLVTSYAWQNDGLCRQLPTDVFFDSERARGHRRELREEAAKRVCRRCPVIAECREHALAAEDFGVWGGLTARERREIRGTLVAAAPVAS